MENIDNNSYSAEYKLRELYDTLLPADHFLDTQLLKHQIYDIFDHNVIREHFFNEGSLTIEQTRMLISESMNILATEPNLLIIDKPVTIIGDLHGQFYDLYNILLRFDFNTDIVLFLGDYVDRGVFSVEVYLYLLSLKTTYPNNVFLLRGNHESERMTTYFTFKTECIYKYDENMYDVFVQSFYSLPLAAVVMNSLYCAHGGISPNIEFVYEINSIDRFREPPFTGVYCDILWSDPHPRFNMKLEYSINTQRNCSFYFSHAAARKFLAKNNLKCIIRGHEVQSDGYKLYVNEIDEIASVITIFSAPNYCDAYNNKGAVLYYDGKSTTIMKFSAVAHPFYLSNYLDSINWSFPFVCEKASEFFLDIIKYLRTKPTVNKQLVQETETFTGSMALMRNERECLTELNDEESSELPCCSLKSIDTDLSYNEAKEMDKPNESSVEDELITEGKSVEVSPSCTNEVSKLLEGIDLLEGIQKTKLDVNEEKKIFEIRMDHTKRNKKKKNVLSDKNK